MEPPSALAIEPLINLRFDRCNILVQVIICLLLDAAVIIGMSNAFEVIFAPVMVRSLASFNASVKVISVSIK